MATRLRDRRRPRRVRDVLVALCMILLLAIGVAWLQGLTAETVVGPVMVVDGDTLTLGDRRLRLHGIDAPEHGQRCRRGGGEFACGIEAARHLGRLVGEGSVRCTLSGQDRYGRALANCTRGGTDLNYEMVRSGQAVAFGAYGHAEALAKAERAGLWGVEFEPPADWRRRQGEEAGTPHPARGAVAAIRAALEI